MSALSRPATYPLTLFFLAVILAPLTVAAAEKNLLHNGDFSVGSGDSVDGWRSDAWILSPGTTDYRWIPPARGKPGELEVYSHRDNDARWLQSLNLSPGWYRMSVEARTHAVLPFFTGASISVLEDGIMSADLKGDTDWQPLSLYLKIGRYGADVDIALRVGGYMNLTRGEAFFRHAEVVKITAPPAGAEHVFDLTEIRRNAATGPIGKPWTLAAAYLGLLLLVIAGWRLMGAGAHPERS